MPKKKYHIGCPNCGKDFAQSGDGTATDTFCPKCKAKISYEVIGTQVQVILLSEPDAALVSAAAVAHT